MPYLIDGTNLLFGIEADDERSAPMTETQICWTLGRFLAAKGDYGVIVFDGSGPENKDALDQVKGLAVTFSGRLKDADTVIVEKLKASPEPKQWTVVTTDRALRQTAHGMGASAVRSDVFWTEVLSRTQDKKIPREPLGKRHGLSDFETDRWLRTFGLEDEDPS